MASIAALMHTTHWLARCTACARVYNHCDCWVPDDDKRVIWSVCWRCIGKG
jgi:hypothetical protein